MRIAILTGGGDVPGLNPCMKAIVQRAIENDWEVVGFRRGWAGPLNVNPDADEGANGEWVVPLDRTAVRTIDRSGGTFLHTSRTNPGKARDRDIPEFLKEDYPVDPKTKIADTTPHVLKCRSAVTTRCPTRCGCTTKAFVCSPFPRRWTTMSTAPTTASGSPPR